MPEIEKIRDPCTQVVARPEVLSACSLHLGGIVFTAFLKGEALSLQALHPAIYFCSNGSNLSSSQTF